MEVISNVRVLLLCNAEQGLAKERVEKDKAMFGGREIAGKTLAIIGMGHIGAATAREASALGMNCVGKLQCEIYPYR